MESVHLLHHKPDDVWWKGRWIDRQMHPDGAQALAFWIQNEEGERQERRWRGRDGC